MRRLSALLLPLALVAACSAPPQKELDMAQGALDAARAAGAEQYAVQEYSAASSTFFNGFPPAKVVHVNQ